MSAIAHLDADGGPAWVVVLDDGSAAPIGSTLADLLALPLADARGVVEAAENGDARVDGGLRLPPVDRQEIWAAGVTYERSRQGREEESGAAALYTAVYDADRPELFFKSVPERVVTDGDAVGIRVDSGWDVPEAELGLVVTSSGDIFGYVVGNDMSSRSIEGENPLYLPQAKVYERSCALGSVIVPAWSAGDGPFAISARIARDEATVWEATTSTASLHRGLDELVDWLLRGLDFPHGVILLTGTGVVPGREITLQQGDVVEIDIDGIGRLTNPVVLVGR